MNKIIVLTSVFPFEVVGENFFESELEGLSKSFDEVCILAVDCNKTSEIKKSLPKNCRAFSIERASVYLDFLLGAVKMPFCPFFYRELREIKRQNKKFLPALKRLFYCGSYYLGICSRLPKAIKRLEPKKEDNVVILSYWLHYTAEAALKLKELLKREDIKVYSRAHGSADVLNLTCPNRYFPFQQNALNSLNGVFAISNLGRDYLRLLSKNPENIDKVYIGAYGHSEAIEHQREKFTVMSCSNLFPYKRVSIIADAIKILKEKIPDIRWVHFGDGFLRKELEEQIAPISQNVSLMGNQMHEAVLDYLKSGDASVFVSASASEGLPVSVLEALGYSLPVIATDVGATNEAVITGKSGILLSQDITAEELAENILRIYNMKNSEYVALSKGAYSIWKEVFAREKNAERLARLLSE